MVKIPNSNSVFDDVGPLIDDTIGERGVGDVDVEIGGRDVNVCGVCAEKVEVVEVVVVLVGAAETNDDEADERGDAKGHRNADA